MRWLEKSRRPLRLPAFLPDGTKGVVRTLDAGDLRQCNLEGLMVNILHLSHRPGASFLKSNGGIHRFMGWNGLIASDSGGFQVFSLMNESPNMCSASPRGFNYHWGGQGKRRTLTPQKAIQKQLQIGSDIIYCLDYCTHPKQAADLQRRSVELTVRWARQCKETFEQIMNDRGNAGSAPHKGDPLDEEAAPPGRPLLFAVVQGGNQPSLRAECAAQLREIGFDGYGFGGWPIDEMGRLVEMVEQLVGMLPQNIPLHALGIGSPGNLVRAHELGYNLFDCTLPTRDARRGRLYKFNQKLEQGCLKGTGFWKYLYLRDKRFHRDQAPVEEDCGCLCCSCYSRAYLYHLFKVSDPLAYRLSTIHNLHFYSRLTACLRESEGSSDSPDPPIREKS